MRFVIVFAIMVALGSCKSKDNGTSVEYHFIPFYYGKLYLERLPFNDEQFQVIDSAVVDAKTTKLTFKVPPQEQSIFQLRIAGQPLRIYFINDVDKIIIRGSTSDPKDYSFANAGYNTHLKLFIDRQKNVAKQMEPIAEKARASSGEEQKKFLSRMDSLKTQYEKNARSFADTTSNAAAFMFAYNSVDFGTDRNSLKHFITKAAERFPEHNNVQTLKQEVMQYTSIFEEELEIGETLPTVQAQDSAGRIVSVSAPAGKFTFVDLWSTWCAPCLNYIPLKKEAFVRSQGRLEMISIAVDAEKEAWQQVLRHQQVPGSHFIDEKMWRGNTVRTWKFDSIPFNYLVGPDGRILAKAIKPDSLMQVLTKFVR